ncbi:MAG: metal ABC transporter ATP-binding protein [Treponemataceae bacterium]|nr:metal ABC transporter ATP-binding protein [Treponemataceae bacterium]
MERTLITCTDVGVQFGSFTALKNVSLELHAGEYLCIVGANGSGKTTLVKTLMGLQKPTSGCVTAHTASIGYLGQKNSIQRDFPATVEEIVLSGNRIRCFASRKDKDNARIQMEKLGITGLAGKPFKDLSGGQQQRVLLARSLCAAKDLLVLDEPVTGLDPMVTDEMYQIIRRLNTEDKLAVLMVSHDIHRAVQNATHILQLDNEPLFYGTAEEYQRTPLYTRMSHVEVCETHFCTHCGINCNASHIGSMRFGGVK